MRILIALIIIAALIIIMWPTCQSPRRPLPPLKRGYGEIYIAPRPPAADAAFNDGWGIGYTPNDADYVDGEPVVDNRIMLDFEDMPHIRGGRKTRRRVILSDPKDTLCEVWRPNILSSWNKRALPSELYADSGIGAPPEESKCLYVRPNGIVYPEPC